MPISFDISGVQLYTWTWNSAKLFSTHHFTIFTKVTTIFINNSFHSLHFWRQNTALINKFSVTFVMWSVPLFFFGYLNIAEKAKINSQTSRNCPSRAPTKMPDTIFCLIVPKEWLILFVRPKLLHDPEFLPHSIVCEGELLDLRLVAAFSSLDGHFFAKNFLHIIWFYFTSPANL